MVKKYANCSAKYRGSMVKNPSNPATITKNIPIRVTLE